MGPVVLFDFGISTDYSILIYKEEIRLGRYPVFDEKFTLPIKTTPSIPEGGLGISESNTPTIILDGV